MESRDLAESLMKCQYFDSPLLLSDDDRQIERRKKCLHFLGLSVGSKGVTNFPRIFFMQCGVKSLLGTSGINPGTYSLGSFAGLFSDAMGLLFSDCIV